MLKSRIKHIYSFTRIMKSEIMNPIKIIDLKII